MVWLSKYITSITIKLKPFNIRGIFFFYGTKNHEIRSIYNTINYFQVLTDKTRQIGYSMYWTIVYVIEYVEQDEKNVFEFRC